MDKDYYAVGNDVRTGMFPGVTVSTHASHSEAVREMLRLNAGRRVVAR